MLPPAPSVYQPSLDGERVEQRDRTRLRLAVDRHADAFETHLHEEAEELPVVLRRLAALDAAQPLDHVVALAPGERVPQVLGREREREPDGGHLDHPLVDGLPARAPVLRARRDRCRWRGRPTTDPSARRSRRRPPAARCPTAVGRSPPVRRPAARTSPRSCRAAPVRRRGRGGGTTGSTRSTTARRTSSLVASGLPAIGLARGSSTAVRAAITRSAPGPRPALRGGAARRRGSGGPRPPRGRPCARSRCRASPRCAA